MNTHDKIKLLQISQHPAEPVKVPSDLPHALRDLVAIWRKQQGEYPAEGKQAAAAVRLCANELELLLSRYGQPAQPAASVDPTDPGYDVEVLREHVRHLERRIRQLHAASAEPDGERIAELEADRNTRAS